MGGGGCGEGQGCQDGQTGWGGEMHDCLVIRCLCGVGGLYQGVMLKLGAW